MAGACPHRVPRIGPTRRAGAVRDRHSRRGGIFMKVGSSRLVGAALCVALMALGGVAQAEARKPNILVIWGDDIGQFNVSAYNNGMMGYKTPNIDSIAREGAMFTDWYGQQSCTAGRAAFVTGQSPIRTGLTKVGLPGAPEGMKAADPTIATLLRAQGYVTGQFGKNHLGDRDEMLPTDARLRRVLRQPLSPQRRGGAGEPRLPEEPRVQEELRSAWRDPQLRRRPHHRHRPAHEEAHGDDRRRGQRQGARLHGARREGRQTVLPVVELHPHAHLHAPEGGVGRQDGPRHLRRRHGRARRPRRPAAREAQGTGPRREHHHHVLDRTTAPRPSRGRTAARRCSAARRTRSGKAVTASRR